MAAEDRKGPFWGPAPKEVPLTHAPLVRVLCQLMFDEILSVGERNFIAKFQEEIRQSYRVFKPEERMIISPAPQPEVRKEMIWRFYDGDEVWRVTLATNFVSLETLHYSSRSDFVNRVSFISDVAERTLAIGGFKRIGIRYVDQIQGEQLADLKDIVHKPFLGVLVDDLQGISHVFSEMQARTIEGETIIKWGMLPIGASHDINVLNPAQFPSWFLDIDVFRGAEHGSGLIPAASVKEVAYSLATRAYSIFKWATNENFAKAYGA